jgi:hypothetical protein
LQGVGADVAHQAPGMTHQRTASLGPGFRPLTGDILGAGNTAILKEIAELPNCGIAGSSQRGESRWMAFTW